MRQKLVPRTVRRPSPTPAVMVRLRSTNTKKIQFTQRLPLGYELHMGRNVVVCEVSIIYMDPLFIPFVGI
ncbi:hypothetical protein AXX17_ATUG02700 (mitochondrion) [Arabidopsis thaliana]|uniref:Uncharacterized protein n=1 Tax=Arabidopsis thaliana TaxID=3702 RepID=A0A178U9A9_ARATH|nr:hypothetical protein AXX17_ATUG02700 [Arabidopsis thaliana]